MALNVLKVILAGNLTRDPEQRYTDSGIEVSQFGLAVNETWKDRNSGEKREKAHFFDCVAFGKTAELINEHFYKGKPIFFEGSPDYSTWETQDGSTRSKVQMKVHNFSFVPEPNGNRSSGGARSQQSPSVDESDFDDLPF
jgi:single-strand DNA-binding protein